MTLMWGGPMYKIVAIFLCILIFSTVLNAKNKIINGIQIDYDIYPAVVKVLPGCTGTFIDHNILITAAHCIYGRYQGEIDQEVTIQTHHKQVTSIKAYVHRKYIRAFSPRQHDLAILEFPNNSAPAIRYIANQTPPVRSHVTLVGHGFQQLDFGNYGTKRYGHNIINSITDYFIIIRQDDYTSETPAGVRSGTSSGDSGGPLFYNNEMIGIVGGGGTKNTKYVNLNDPDNREFINKTLETIRNNY